LIANDPGQTFIIGREYQQTIIPCKPTAPDVDIRLYPNFVGNVSSFFC
jgi:hypothetical protein